MNQNPKGRLDILVLRFGEELARRMNPAPGNPLWNGSETQSGMKAAVDALIDEAGIPRAPIDFTATIADKVFGIKLNRSRRRPNRIHASLEPKRARSRA